MTTIFTALVVFGMMFLVIQGILKTQWAVLLVLSFLPLEQLLSSYIPLLARTSWITNVGVGLIALFALGLEFARGNRPLNGYFNSTWVLVALLYVFTVLGIFWSPIPEAGKYFFRTGFPYWMLLLVILPGLIRDLENIRKFVVPFMIIGSLIVVLILNSPNTRIYGGRFMVDLSDTLGSSKALTNPLATAELGGAILIVAALYKPTVHVKPVLLIRIAAVFAGIGIMVLSGTRGQLVFSVMLSVLFFPVAYQIKNISQFFLTSAAAAVMGGAFYIALKAFFGSTDANTASRWTTEGISRGLSGRQGFATLMLGEYFSSPGAFLGGLGTGAFNFYSFEQRDRFLYPHNLLIEVLTEHGIIGFGLLMGIFYTMAKGSLRLFRMYRDNPTYRPVCAILYALCAYVTLISMKQGSYALVPLPFFWYLVLAKIEHRARNQAEADQQLNFNDDYDSYDEYSDYQDYGDEYSDDQGLTEPETA
jgi:hypothetical protein